VYVQIINSCHDRNKQSNKSHIDLFITIYCYYTFVWQCRRPSFMVHICSFSRRRRTFVNVANNRYENIYHKITHADWLTEWGIGERESLSLSMEECLGAHTFERLHVQFNSLSLFITLIFFLSITLSLSDRWIGYAHPLHWSDREREKEGERCRICISIVQNCYFYL